MFDEAEEEEGGTETSEPRLSSLGWRSGASDFEGLVPLSAAVVLVGFPWMGWSVRPLSPFCLVGLLLFLEGLRAPSASLSSSSLELASLLSLSLLPLLLVVLFFFLRVESPLFSLSR